MKKFVKVLAISALAATTLVGCGKKGESTGGDASGAKYAKAGLGVVTSMGHDDSKQVNTTFVGLGLDSAGKIAWIDLDVAQGTPGGNELTQTKEQRKEDYNMKGSSGIGKEWYEQAAAFEEYCKGKTPEEISKIKVNDEGKPTGTDLNSSCTMAITDFQAAVAKAVENAQDVSTNKLSLGRTMSYESDTYKEPWTYLTTDLALVATGDDGKIQWIDIDTAKIPNNGSQLKTKTELKEAYNMKGASGIGKEWYEQVAALEEYCKGKTADDIAKIAVNDEGKPTGTDLNSGCTIVVTQFQKAIADAMGK